MGIAVLGVTSGLAKDTYHPSNPMEAKDFAPLLDYLLWFEAHHGRIDKYSLRHLGLDTEYSDC